MPMKKANIEVTEQKLLEMQQEIEQLKEQLAEESRKVADYQRLLNSLDEYKDKIKSQNREIRRERNRYKRATEELQARNEEVERKSDELTEIMHIVDAQKDKVKGQKKTLMRQKRDLDASNKMLAKMNQELSEKNRELTRMSEELYRLAHTDALTDLYNRRTFMDEMEREFSKAIRYDRVLCCIIMDIDNFKNINDTYGHLQGDEVLRQISKIAKDVSRNCDMVARYGGEEFVVLLPETDSIGGGELGERLRKAVEKFKFPRFDAPSKNIKITISVGVADSREKCVGHHENLLNCADTALYFAKNHGKNMVKVFDAKEESFKESDGVIPFPSSNSNDENS